MNIEIYNDDCRNVLSKIASNSVDAIVMDPPFGIGFQYQNKESHDDPKSYSEFLLPIVSECLRIAKPGAFIAIWQSSLYFKHFWNWFGDQIHIYIAAKNFVQLRKTPINYSYDPVVIWYKEGEPLKPTNPKRNVDYFVSNTAAIVSDTTRIEKGHPCPRPLDSVTEIVENFVIPEGKVLDPFMGSGTTGLACKLTGRHFVGIEMDPKYFDIAKKRLETCQTLPFE